MTLWELYDHLLTFTDTCFIYQNQWKPVAANVVTIHDMLRYIREVEHRPEYIHVINDAENKLPEPGVINGNTNLLPLIIPFTKLNTLATLYKQSHREPDAHTFLFTHDIWTARQHGTLDHEGDRYDANGHLLAARGIK
jgi:hypothetical protein